MARHNSIENVLILQGGGSLGAFGCGVFKALAESRVKLDILAGTSIGGINAAIVAGSKDKQPEFALEQFWLELAENSIDLVPPPLMSSIPLAPSVNESESYYSSNHPQASLSLRQALSFYSAALYGNRMMYLPRWRPEYAIKDPKYFRPHEWTYIYDHSPLASTLEKYINYDKLRPGGNPNTRLIITAVNVLTAEPMTFDSAHQQITVKHLLGTSGYPLYGFPWVEVEKGMYVWDGSLLSNTPLREAIDASPVIDKQVFIVENYPKKIERLPQNLPEVLHRARDIMFSDKTAHNIKLSKVITRHLEFIEELYKIIEKNVDPSKIDRQELDNIHKKYKRMMKEHGAEIKKIVYITREEQFPYLYENTDFTEVGIKNLIKEGESKTKQALRKIGL
ncbi:MAG: putative pyridine nucleotide-disulfide oxidoreductase family protein [Nitrososphaera sp.]|jgi:NTE family protein|nr:putative pyridine nucleotide-disulfide oxidoreductase family protein [Nitrososphaera sp.]